MNFVTSLAGYRPLNDAAMIILWILGLAFGRAILVAGISSNAGVRWAARVRRFDISLR